MMCFLKPLLSLRRRIGMARPMFMTREWTVAFRRLRLRRVLVPRSGGAGAVADLCDSSECDLHRCWELHAGGDREGEGQDGQGEGQAEVWKEEQEEA